MTLSDGRQSRSDKVVSEGTEGDGLRVAHDDSFRFGGRATAHSVDCCGKPQGCNNPTEGCLYKGHPFKRHIYTDEGSR